MTEDAECAQNIKAFIAQMIDAPLRQQVGFSDVEKKHRCRSGLIAMS
jgi:hypothetical protein